MSSPADLLCQFNCQSEYSGILLRVIDPGQYPIHIFSALIQAEHGSQVGPPCSNSSARMMNQRGLAVGVSQAISFRRQCIAA